MIDFRNFKAALKNLDLYNEIKCLRNKSFGLPSAARIKDAALATAALGKPYSTYMALCQ